MAKAKFVGGPLAGQKKQMDIYVDVIPVIHFGLNPLGQPIAYYKNVNTRLVGMDMTNQLATVYVFFINGVMYSSIDKEGQYAK